MISWDFLAFLKGCHFNAIVNEPTICSNLNELLQFYFRFNFKIAMIPLQFESRNAKQCNKWKTVWNCNKVSPLNPGYIRSSIALVQSPRDPCSTFQVDESSSSLGTRCVPATNSLAFSVLLWHGSFQMLIRWCQPEIFSSPARECLMQSSLNVNLCFASSQLDRERGDLKLSPKSWILFSRRRSTFFSRSRGNAEHKQHLPVVDRSIEERSDRN